MPVHFGGLEIYLTSICRVLSLYDLNYLSHNFQYVGVHSAVSMGRSRTVLILTYSGVELCDSENAVTLFSNAVLSFGTGVLVEGDFTCAGCSMSDPSPLRAL